MMIKFLISLLLAGLVVGSYHPDIAHKLGIAETATYTSEKEVTSWSCKHCHEYPLVQTKVFANPVLDIFGFTGFSQQDNAIIVAFRGTVDIQNWIANLDVAQVSYPGCKSCMIHQGFYNAYQSVSGYVKANIQKLQGKHPGSKMYVTGFSLGGALATIAALDIKKSFGKVDELYTFGQPRVGNQAFATFVTNQIPNRYRVIHYADIVPHLPPQFPITYSHFSYEIWYDEKMSKYKQCGAQQFSCSKSLLPNQWSTDDHNLEVYIKLPTSKYLFSYW